MTRPTNPLRPTRLPHQLLVSAFSLLLGGACADSNDPAGDTDGVPQTSESGPLDTVRAALGDPDALDSLRGMRYQSRGIDRIDLEGKTPDTVLDGRTYERTVSVDLEQDSIRLDVDATLAFHLLAGAPQQFVEYVVGDSGAITDGEHAFGVPGGPPTSDRVGATQQRVALLNPHLLVRELEEDDIVASPDVELNGVGHSVFTADVDGRSFEFLIHKESGDLVELRTRENHRIYRDTDLTVAYSGWQGDTLRFPSEVSIAVNGSVMVEDSRDPVEVDPVFEIGFFDMGVETPAVDIDALERGRREHHFNQAFSSIGIPLDGFDPNVDAMELAPGLFFVTGPLHNSMVVEQESGIVVIDAPNSSRRTDAILGWIETTFPGKSVSHVVPSHFHQDHAAGSRQFVAAGAKLVAVEVMHEYWSGVLAAPSTIVADGLEGLELTPEIVDVPAGESLTLEDDLLPIEVIHIPSEHAEDMTLVSVPADGANFVFVADIYAPFIGSLDPTGPLETIQGLQQQGWLDETCHNAGPIMLVGAHGGVEPVADAIISMQTGGFDLSSLGCAPAPKG